MVRAERESAEEVRCERGSYKKAGGRREQCQDVEREGEGAFIAVISLDLYVHQTMYTLFPPL